MTPERHTDNTVAQWPLFAQQLFAQQIAPLSFLFLKLMVFLRRREGLRPMRDEDFVDAVKVVYARPYAGVHHNVLGQKGRKGKAGPPWPLLSPGVVVHSLAAQFRSALPPRHAHSRIAQMTPSDTPSRKMSSRRRHKRHCRHFRSKASSQRGIRP